MKYVKNYSDKEALNTIRNNLMMINAMIVATTKVIDALEEKLDDKS